MPTRTSPPRSLLLVRVVALLVVASSLPIGGALVFGLGWPRGPVADAVAWAFSTGLAAAFSSAFWPLPALRDWPLHDRLRSAALLFVSVSVITHLTWELAWLLLHGAIASARDQWWAYPWWAYIDGGDARYMTAPVELVTIECLSVANGVVGGCGLWRLRTRGERDPAGILLLLAMAVVHIYSTSYYYLTEVLAGLPNVNTSHFTDLWIKFGLTNAPWLLMPWVVIAWGARSIARAPRSDVTT